MHNELLLQCNCAVFAICLGFSLVLRSFGTYIPLVESVDAVFAVTVSDSAHKDKHEAVLAPVFNVMSLK